VIGRNVSGVSEPRMAKKPACLKAEITRECRRLHQVIVMIAELEAKQAAALDAEEGQAARLIRLRGIGLVSATVLADEVFFPDFRNRREVAGYLGLASSPWASGRVKRDQGITKSGNPRARRTANRTRLVVAAASAGQLPDAMVPPTRRDNPRPDATDHTRGVGPQTDRRLMALSE
jgi:transposase